jgi:hypothetical protein
MELAQLRQRPPRDAQPPTSWSGEGDASRLATLWRRTSPAFADALGKEVAELPSAWTQFGHNVKGTRRNSDALKRL